MKIKNVAIPFVYFALVLSVPLLGEDEVMTPEKIVGMKRIMDPQLSPDGNKVTYVLRSLDKTKHSFTTDIYIADAATGETIRMTYQPDNDSRPRWSPDGKKIAFFSNRSGKMQIWLIPVSGGEARQLTELEEGWSGGFEWSPDGTRIAFVTPRELTEDEEKDKEDKRDEVVVDETMRLNQLAVVDLETGVVSRLTDGKSDITAPCWSSDNSRIAFVSRPSKDVDDYFLSKIYVIDSSGGRPERLTDSEAMRESSPKWSPVGDSIAFSGQPGYDRWADPGDVYVVNAGGGSPANLTAELDRAESVVSWSGDGQSILFSYGEKTYSQLGRVDVRTKKIDILIPKGKILSGTSANAALSQLAVVMTDPLHPRDLWVGDIRLENSRCLVQSNPDVQDLKLGRTQVIKWKSFDDREIEGLLVLPVGYQEGQRVPLIVEPHGGPQGVRTVAFNPAWQMFAGAGYGVLVPNFRGSGSHGKEFVRANIGDWGGGDYKDVMAGVDYVIKQGIADETKLGVEGWSYGGFMTNWIITHTDRFKAAVSGAGLSNLESFYGTTDIQGFMEYYHKGFPWMSRDVYRGSSPLASDFRPKTPTLILHGEEDRRVPVSQGEELYHYLKKIGVTVRFVRYPREPHGLREPNHQLDRYTRMLDWFDTYILGKTPRKTTEN